MKNNKYFSFWHVKKLVKKFGIKSQSEWFKWCRSGKRPSAVPLAVNKVYKKEWRSWYDFLDKIPRKLLKYKACCTLMKQLCIKSEKEYYNLNREIYNLPYNPEEVYSGQWKDWSVFLGKDIRNKGRTYTLNHDYFKKWSHDGSYILGLWFADGYIGDGILSITLHKDDGYLLRKIFKKLEANYPITIDSNAHIARLHSADLIKDVIGIFGKNKKYLRHKFPKIPKKYLPDFIRGLWDGDGSVYHNKERKDYRSSLTCGSLYLLRQIHVILKDNIKGINGYIKTNIQNKGKIVCGHPLKKKSTVYVLRLGPNDTRRLRDFMYNTPSDLKMIRKYKKFLDAGKLCLAPQDKMQSYINFYSARKYIRKLNIKNIQQWRKYCVSGKKPDNIPSVPYRIYKQWRGYKNWMGTERKYLSFYNARKIIRTMMLKSVNEWYQYIRSNKYRQDVPTHPFRNYKEHWRGYRDWLGLSAK